MTRGIVLLAFGRDFERLAAASVEHYSQQHTDLPFHVVTNVTSPGPLPKDTTFSYVDLPTERNRQVKVSLYEHTPFDETLFMDCDAVIQNPGIGAFFTDLEEHDVCAQHSETIRSYEHRGKSRFYRTFYLDLMEKLDEPYPLAVMHSAAFLWKQSDGAKRFFDRWRELWEMGGSRRDMPGFSLAARTPGVAMKVYQAKRDGFLANGRFRDRVIQHRGYRQFVADHPKLPGYRDWNP